MNAHGGSHGVTLVGGGHALLEIIFPRFPRISVCSLWIRNKLLPQIPHCSSKECFVAKVAMYTGLQGAKTPLAQSIHYQNTACRANRRGNRHLWHRIF